MMAADAARDLRTRHDTAARALTRKTRGQLAVIYRDAQRTQGIELLHGGPGSKDELINAIMAIWYPPGQLNEAIHVLYHQDSAGWSACEHCHPHTEASGCDCAIGRAEAAGRQAWDVSKPALQARLSDA